MLRKNYWINQWFNNRVCEEYNKHISKILGVMLSAIQTELRTLQERNTQLQQQHAARKENTALHGFIQIL